MKKVFVLIACVAAFGISAVVVSCGEDDNGNNDSSSNSSDNGNTASNWKGCTCVLYNIQTGAYVETKKHTAEYLKGEGYSSCSQVQAFYRAGGNTKNTCTDT